MLPVIISFGKFNIYSLGFFLATGAMVSSFLVWRRLRDLGLKEEKIIDFLLALTLLGLVGARLIYIATHFPQFGLALKTWWLFGQYPGLSFWGAILGFSLALVIFVRKQKWSFWPTADELFLALLPLLIFCQVGCFFDGCRLGKPTTMIWGIYLPGSFLRRQPISAFASLGLFLLWIFLLYAERRWRLWSWYQSKDGFITLTFFAWLAALNFALAFWHDSPVYLSWLEIFLSAVGLAVAGGIFYWRSRGFSFSKKDGQKSKKRNY